MMGILAYQYFRYCRKLSLMYVSILWLESLQKPKKACRARTGYMLFHGEARKRIRAAHPELNFVEVSKRVGEEVSCDVCGYFD